MKGNAYRNFAVLYINGRRHEVRGKDAGMMLADFLRYKLGLFGTKIVCAEGDCGACSVLKYFCGADQKPRFYQPINSCITTVAQNDCSSLVTVDFLGSEKLDPVQEAMVQNHGSQCGFCTPGFVVAIKGLAERRICTGKTDSISIQEAKNALTGNLCRCTGYKQILDSVLSLKLENQPSIIKSKWHSTAVRELADVSKTPLLIDTKEYTFFAPTTVKMAAGILSKNKNTKIIGAGTDLGVHVTKRKARYQNQLSLHLIEELYKISAKNNRIYIGARATLEELRTATKKSIPIFSSYLDIFASPQIKNSATLVGNICNASPIGDTLPFLLAMNATVYIESSKGKRKISLNKFYLDYKKTDLKPGEIVLGVEFDIPDKKESVILYKSSQRKDLDISAVNGAIRIGKENRIALGGIAAIPKRISEIENIFSKNGINEESLTLSLEILQKSITPQSDLRGSASFRRLLVKNFLKSSIEKYLQENG